MTLVFGCFFMFSPLSCPFQRGSCEECFFKQCPTHAQSHIRIKITSDSVQKCSIIVDTRASQNESQEHDQADAVREASRTADGAAEAVFVAVNQTFAAESDAKTAAKTAAKTTDHDQTERVFARV